MKNAELSDDELEGPDASEEDILEAWKEVIMEALDTVYPERAGLSVMLRWHAKHNRPVPPYALKFLAWLVKEKEKHRPSLPAMFKDLKAIARNTRLYAAVEEFRSEREEWKANNPRRKFPYESKLQAKAAYWGIHRDTLNHALRRSRKVPT
jgi:hypothetical protein